MAEDIGNIYKTKIPSYAEAADIQAALKLFHYGTTTVPTQEDDILEDSLAGHLKDLQDQVTSIETIGIGSDFLTIAQIGSLTDPKDGFIAMASDSSGAPITTTYATAIYQNEAPTEDLIDGLVWVDKDSSPRRAYIYNEALSSWDIVDDIQSIIDSAGDIIYGTANDSVEILPIGTAGQVLTVNSGATAPEWTTISSGGMTLIQETTASANTSISFSGISQQYKDLLLIWEGIYHSDTTTSFDIRLNNDSGNNYYGVYFYGNPTAFVSSNTAGYGSMNFVIDLWAFGKNSTATSTQYSRHMQGSLRINNYASSSKFKHFSENFGGYGSSGNAYFVNAEGTYASTTPITSIDIVRMAGTGNFSNAANTSIRLYGVS